ncbi:MAG: glycosyltransferase family 2 protein, partial [Myxococcales bacterium]|nr:glycosyltransferase family 2 protein [Myxococcales bacterium]
MIHGKRVGIVMPAYNAAATVSDVLARVPEGLADEVLLVDDASTDGTASVARALGIDVIEHAQNRGYGANQKTCYDAMLARGVDVVAMLHPDDQYSGALLPELVTPIVDGEYDLMLGSRFCGLDPRDGGMPQYKFVMNRLLTWSQNRAMGT